MIKAKTFIHALSIFSTDPQKSKRFLEDQRLTRAEKSILRGFFLFRDSKHDEIIELLKGIGEVTDPVVKSQFHLLMGMTLNRKNQHQSALKELQTALELLPEEELPSFAFIIHLNIFIVHFNLKDSRGMREQLEHIKKFELDTTTKKIRYLFSQYLHSSFLGENERAGQILGELDQLKPEMAESDIVAHLLRKFDFSMRMGDLQQARVILREMKDNRKFSLSENYRFLKKLLDHLQEQKPLYFQDSEFEKQPILFYQIKVIQLLEERKIAEATLWWEKLAKLLPDYYRPSFQYAGPPGIFSRCLELHPVEVVELPVLDEEGQGKTQLLVDFLEKSTGPVSREVLFKVLWGREPKDKEDFVRLSRKIYRIKKRLNIDIQYKKGCYLIPKGRRAA